MCYNNFILPMKIPIVVGMAFIFGWKRILSINANLGVDI